jgi:hypothetical protein
MHWSLREFVAFGDGSRNEVYFDRMALFGDGSR